MQPPGAPPFPSIRYFNSDEGFGGGPPFAGFKGWGLDSVAAGIVMAEATKNSHDCSSLCTKMGCPIEILPVSQSEGLARRKQIKSPTLVRRGEQGWGTRNASIQNQSKLKAIVRAEAHAALSY